MTSKEMEARSGVPRANIRYYEAEGLLTPQRAKNGYRDYSEADLAVLEKIKLLRLGEQLSDPAPEYHGAPGLRLPVGPGGRAAFTFTMTLEE